MYKAVLTLCNWLEELGLAVSKSMPVCVVWVKGKLTHHPSKGHSLQAPCEFSIPYKPHASSGLFDHTWPNRSVVTSITPPTYAIKVLVPSCQGWCWWWCWVGAHGPPILLHAESLHKQVTKLLCCVAWLKKKRTIKTLLMARQIGLLLNGPHMSRLLLTWQIYTRKG